MDMILRQARLADGSLCDIAIEAGRIMALDASLAQSATVELELAGRLTLPAFVNGQLHSCKAFWRRHLVHLPTDLRALPRFEAAKHVKRRYNAEDVAARVDEVVRLAVQHGSCALRLFCDVDEDAGLQAFHGLMQVKRRYEPLITVQVVAFPQAGMGGRRTPQLMQEALAAGADVVGGIPWIEPDEAAQEAHIEMCFSLAEQFQRPLHFVADDTTDPASRTLERIAHKALALALHHQVSVTQCASLAFQEDAYAARVIGLLKDAGMTVFSNAHVSLITTERRQEPYPRGVTRIRELLDAGVPVACAQDDVDNWYYPFGRNDMLEVAAYMAHVAPLAWEEEVAETLAMVTSVAARALGLVEYGLQVGNHADLVVLEAPDWRSALQFQVPKRYVILKGQLVAESWLEQSLRLGR